MKNIPLLILFSIPIILSSCEKKDASIEHAQSKNSSERIEANIKSDIIIPDKKLEIPTVVSNFKGKFYPNIDVAQIEIKNSSFQGKSYKVKLVDATEIELNENEDWIEIKDIKGVSPELLPSEIKSYLESNYKNIGIKQIEKERRGYKIELLTNTDLEFDLNGKLHKVD